MRAKSLVAGAGVLSAVLALPTAAMALDAVAVTDLNMRAGPGSQYPIVTTIRENGSVDILGCLPDAKWCQVIWQGNEGWSYSEYLAVTETDERIFVPQARSVLDIPVVAFEGAANVAGAAVGGAADVAGAAVGGAADVAGAAVGGAANVAGSIIGGVANLATTAVTPPGHVRAHVLENRYDPVLLRGEVVTGARLPDVVELRPVPDYRYHYAYVNGVPVLVDPQTRRIVHVYH